MRALSKRLLDKRLDSQWYVEIAGLAAVTALVAGAPIWAILSAIYCRREARRVRS